MQHRYPLTLHPSQKCDINSRRYSMSLTKSDVYRVACFISQRYDNYTCWRSVLFAEVPQDIHTALRPKLRHKRAISNPEGSRKSCEGLSSRIFTLWRTRELLICTRYRHEYHCFGRTRVNAGASSRECSVTRLSGPRVCLYPAYNTHP